MPTCAAQEAPPISRLKKDVCWDGALTPADNTWVVVVYRNSEFGSLLIWARNSCGKWPLVGWRDKVWRELNYGKEFKIILFNLFQALAPVSSATSCSRLEEVRQPRCSASPALPCLPASLPASSSRRSSWVATWTRVWPTWRPTSTSASAGQSKSEVRPYEGTNSDVGIR